MFNSMMTIVVELLPHICELQLRTVLVDDAMFDVPAQSNSLALFNSLSHFQVARNVLDTGLMSSKGFPTA